MYPDPSGSACSASLEGQSNISHHAPPRPPTTCSQPCSGLRGRHAGPISRCSTNLNGHASQREGENAPAAHLDVFVRSAQSAGKQRDSLTSLGPSNQCEGKNLLDSCDALVRLLDRQACRSQLLFAHPPTFVSTKLPPEPIVIARNQPVRILRTHSRCEIHLIVWLGGARRVATIQLPGHQTKKLARLSPTGCCAAGSLVGPRVRGLITSPRVSLV